MTKDVHTEHCCIHHGCKYGQDDCPVETKQKRQSFPCEECGHRSFKVEQALKSFVSDFETDFVLDGVIVDEPDKRWGCLTRLYKEARAALDAEEGW